MQPDNERRPIEGQPDLEEETYLQGLFAGESPLRKMFDNIPVAISCITLAPDHRIIYINEQFIYTFGYTLEDIPTVAECIARVIPDEQDRAATVQLWTDIVIQARQGEFHPEPMELRITCKDGRVLDTLTNTAFFDGLILLSLVDITERKRLEDELRESEQRHRLLADNAGDVIYTIDADGRFTYASPSVERLLGYTSAEVMGLTLDDILTPDGAASARAGLARTAAALQEGLPVFDDREDVLHVCKDGSHVWAEVTSSCMVNPAGQYIGTLVVARDITERKNYEHEIELAHDALTAANQALQQANTELSRLATVDTLTGIWNRHYIEEFLAGEIEQAQRFDKPLSLLIFDLDRFKAINDQYGHRAGDRVLVEMCRRLRRSLRISDQLARWGGDEFVVVAPYCRAADALRLAERLRVLLETQPFDEVGVMTASFGVAELEADETLDSWFTRADNALYESKAAGRNIVRLAASRWS